MADELEEEEARARAKRWVAYVLVGAIVVMLLADIIVPDEQFHLDYVAFPAALTAILLLLDIRVPWVR